MNNGLDGAEVRTLIEDNVQPKPYYECLVSSGGLIDMKETIIAAKNPGKRFDHLQYIRSNLPTNSFVDRLKSSTCLVLSFKHSKLRNYYKDNILQKTHMKYDCDTVLRIPSLPMQCSRCLMLTTAGPWTSWSTCRPRTRSVSTLSRTSWSGYSVCLTQMAAVPWIWTKLRWISMVVYHVD